MLNEKNIELYEKIKAGYEQRGFNIAVIDLALTKTKHEWLKEFSRQLRFPSEPTNWDAFDDWITDLEWLTSQNTVVLIKSFDNMKDKNVKILLEILEDAKKFHAKYNVEFDVIVFKKMNNAAK